MSMQPSSDIHTSHAGFTLVEIMVTLAIIAILSALTLVNLGRPQTSASLNSTVDMLVADLSSERMLAMAGDAGNAVAAQPHGIQVQSTAYVLFVGNTFNGADTGNFSVDAGDGVQLSTTFADGQVLFDKISGEVQNYDANNNTITASGGGLSRTVTVNRYGVVTVE
jgi:type IV fimbrial biogenesis protein FimT